MYNPSKMKYKKELLPSNNNNITYTGITYLTLSEEYKCRNIINYAITMCNTLLKSTLKNSQSVIAFFLTIIASTGQSTVVTA